MVQDKSKAEKSVKGSGGENSRESRHAGFFKKKVSVGVLETLLSLKICSRMCPRMDSQLPVLSQRRRPGPKKNFKGRAVRCLAVLKVSSEFSETLFSLKIVRE